MTDLARELGKLGAWVRLHYVYPYPHVDRVIPLMAEGLVLPYLDIPFQHASPKILKAMKRPANEARVLERLAEWRAICPDIAIRSSFVVGFPGETEEDFQYLLDWLARSPARPRRRLPLRAGRGRRRQRPARSGARRGQGRALRPHHGAHRRNQRRQARRPRSAARSTCIIDAVDADSGGATGRSKADAPEIDGEVHLRDAGHLAQGDIVPVLVEDADEHDLYGVPA